MRCYSKTHENRQHGFTLLEAIVALVILASSGMALYAWINTNFISLRRVQAIQQQQPILQNTLAFAETLNPMLKPRGESTIGKARFRWESTTLEPPKDSLNYRGFVGLYRVGLYEVTLQTEYPQMTLPPLIFRQVGYEQVRDANESLQY